MIIRNLLKKGTDNLRSSSQTAELDAEILLAHILKEDRAYLLAHHDEEVQLSQQIEFFELIKRRRHREPIAYLTGHKEFYGLDFFVSPQVLVPRPETEQLVDLAYEIVSEAALPVSRQMKQAISVQKHFRIVDMGTGSGNILIALIHKIQNSEFNIQHFEFVFADISEKALAVAKKNHNRLILDSNVQTKFIRSNLFSHVDGTVDIIISNPPYIPEEEIDLLDPTVKDYEPFRALNGGEGGIELIQRLLLEGISLLRLRGVLLFEIYHEHPTPISSFLKKHFTDIEVTFEKDDFGMWRYCLIRKL